jgi:hypothetical protein
MTKRWISDDRQRRSRKFRELHAQLKAEMQRELAPQPDKRERKRAKSAEFRAHGE